MISFGIVLAGLLAGGVCVAQDWARAPEQTLSCAVGGEQIFVNREHGITADFPTDSSVCERPMWSSEPDGFIAQLRVSSRKHGFLDPGPMIDIRADYYEEAPSRTLLVDDACLGDTVPGPNGQALALKGVASWACIIAQDEVADRPIIVVVGAAPLTGVRAREYGPFITYTVTLVSSSETFEEDLVTFQRFLDQLILAPG